MNPRFNLLFLFFFCTFAVSAQSLFDNQQKQPKKKEYIVKTSTANRSTYLPPAGSKKFKFKIENFDVDTRVEIYCKEYSKEKLVETDREENYIYGQIHTPQRNCIFEISLDESNKKRLKIYTVFPNEISYTYRDLHTDKHFDGVPFQFTKKKNKEVPLLLIYEDNTDKHVHTNQILPYLKGDSLTNAFDAHKKPFSSLNRYLIIYYHLTDNK